MRRFIFFSILLVPLVVVTIAYVAKRPSPLIFFSSASPVPEVPWQGRANESVAALMYGDNLINDKKWLIIKGEENRADSFESVQQAAQFIIRNSVHGPGEWRSLEGNVQILFHSPEPIVLSCGKISRFFQELVIEHMKVERRRVRYITLFDERGLDPSSVTDGYLQGGHAVLEIYFPNLQKWVVFDLDKGIIPTLGDKPLSMIDIQALGSNEIAFEPLGRDEYGKGPNSKKAVSRYYNAARNYFGIRSGKGYVFLFSGSVELAETFRQNFEKANKQEATIVTNREAYRKLFYSKEP